MKNSILYLLFISACMNANAEFFELGYGMSFGGPGRITGRLYDFYGKTYVADVRATPNRTFNYNAAFGYDISANTYVSWQLDFYKTRIQSSYSYPYAESSIDVNKRYNRFVFGLSLGKYFGPDKKLKADAGLGFGMVQFKGTFDEFIDFNLAAKLNASYKLNRFLNVGFFAHAIPYGVDYSKSYYKVFPQYLYLEEPKSMRKFTYNLGVILRVNLEMKNN